MSFKAAGSKRILSEEEWETLRPFIQFHYIDENKPFPQVARILREEYGFEPTKKQFTRRIEKWAMKKNVSQSDRKDFLKGHLRVGDIGTADRRFHSAKIENWRKRHKDESATGYTTQNTQQLNSDSKKPENEANTMCLDHRNEDQETQNTRMFLSLREVDSMAADTSVDHYAYELAFDTSEELCPYEDEPEILGFEHVEVPNQIATRAKPDGLSFDWGSVDITGPTGLTQLFRGLEIECSRPQELATTNHQGEEETDYICGNELQNVWNSNNQSRQFDTEPVISSYPIRAHQYGSWSSSYRPYSLALAPSTISLDFELYPFPSSTGKVSGPLASPRTTVWANLVVERSNLRSRLRMLKQQSLGSCHPLSIRTITELAWVYYDMSQYGHALKLFRQLLNLNLKVEGSSPIEKLQACLDVVNCLGMQCKYQEAQVLLQQVFQAAKRLVDPEHGLMVEIRLLMADMYFYLGRYGEAEDYYREILQLKLMRSGPRSEAVKNVLPRLATTFGNQTKRAKEGERLLRTFLQLTTDGQPHVICKAMNSISVCLCRQKLMKEYAAIAGQAVERCERELGPMHEITCEARYRLACYLAESGELTESEKLHRMVYHKRSKLFGCKHYDTLNSVYSLGYVVEKLGRVEEATEWFEKAFYWRLEIFGAGHLSTTYSCTLLGESYEKQGRFEDAIEVYEKYLEKLREYDEIGNDDILSWESWMNWNLKQIRERELGSSGENVKTFEEGDETAESG